MNEISHIKEKIVDQVQQFALTHFVQQDDFRRGLYARLKYLLNRRETRQRQQLAREGHHHPSFILDKNLGFLRLKKNSLGNLRPLVQEAQSLLHKTQNERLYQSKHFLSKSLLDSRELSVESPFIQFALSAPVLATVIDYLGVIPLLNKVEVRYSRHSSGELGKSQLFHCDTAERSQVKIFVYCSEVNDDCGPLTFLPAAHSRLLRKKISYKYGGEKTYLQDQDLAEAGFLSSTQVATGEEESVVIIDSSQCFHMGSRVQNPESHRLVALFQFITPLGMESPLFLKKAGSPFTYLNSTSANLTSIQRMVLDGRA